MHATGAAQIGEACRAHGFFYVSHHGVDPALVQRLETLSHRFFALPEATKMQWRMALGGRAWRGDFPLGGELTSGRPDWKEGLYLGTELPPDDPRVAAGWIDAPPVSGTFVCNIGDMLDRMTGGRYKSTPHRVKRNTSGRDRLSFPLFFDPNFEARVQRIEELAGAQALDDSALRWDRANVHAFNGRYGDYLLAKVSKVFPQLRDAVL